MVNRILQCNIGRNWAAQSLLLKQVQELGADVCVISEPPRVPESEGWYTSKDGLAAIYLKDPRAGGRLIKQAMSFVIVEWKDIHIISVYISPNADRADFLLFLDDLGLEIHALGERILVGGDFNSKSSHWGSRSTDARGALVEEWAAECDLQLINEGDAPTCIRPQGRSIIDLTWGSEDICRKVNNWQVRNDIESLSDHQYITMDIGLSPGQRQNQRDSRYPRWSWGKCDADVLKASLCWEFMQLPAIGETSAEIIAKQIRKALQMACDASTPRVRNRPNCRPIFWWTEEIDSARKVSIRARRKWTRAKIKMHDEEKIAELRKVYNEARKVLRNKISKAKTQAWQDLIGTIDADPWGIPYKLVMKKLRSMRSNLTESMRTEDLAKVLEGLFPVCEETDTTEFWRARGCAEVDAVHANEISGIIKKKKSMNTAPGIDGVRIGTFRCLSEYDLTVLARCFTKCLEEGKFPKEWKQAYLVLIPKEWPLNPDSPKVRPICLLNETGKLLEAIIVNRMVDWMNENPNSQLSDQQYGFRQNRSTTDALMLLKSAIEGVWEEKGIAIAVSIDIQNEFNSLPWDAIRSALRRKGFPDYIRRLVDDYLSARSVEYIGEDGCVKIKKMTAGVPQGSVLGPLLWNVSYDSVLQEGTDFGCMIICYADDTLVLGAGEDLDTAVARTNVQVGRVLNRIHRLGLRVATQKTEAVCFAGRRRRNRVPVLDINGACIETAPSMKYLGVIVDRRLTFKDHFEYMAEKANRVSRNLCRILPNLRGPRETKRKLFANVVNSVILYAAPVWSTELLSSRRGRERLDQLARVINLRVISGYRTVSLEASSLLARIPPLHLQANERARIYERTRDRRALPNWSEGDAKRVREEEAVLTVRQWTLQIQKPTAAGRRTREAILPSLNEWLGRAHGGASFHLTQILTGHGCFGVYLHRIQKLDTPICLHCGSGDVDDADHVLQSCDAWEVDREALARVIGDDLRLPTIIKKMSISVEAWEAVTRFSDEVMEEKEACERKREEEEAEGLRNSRSLTDSDTGASPVPDGTKGSK